MKSGNEVRAKQLSINNSIILDAVKAQVIYIFKNLFRTRNHRFLILIFFSLIPFMSFSNRPPKKAKRIQTVKTIKRNVLDIEFGTFNYSSPVLSKKSKFLGWFPFEIIKGHSLFFLSTIHLQKGVHNITFLASH